MARPKNYFAVTRFSIQDVLALRPEWDAKQARDFLAKNEEAITSAMAEAGSGTIEDLLAAVAE